MAGKKVIVVMGWSSFVMDEAAGLALFRALNGGEIEEVKSEWNPTTKTNTEWVAPKEPGFVQLKSISAETYAILRLQAAAQREKEEQKKNDNT